MTAAALPPPRIVIGDCREALRQFPDGHFQSVITSPPYWGARVYADSEAWTGGDPKCNHGQKCREWALYRQGNEGRERPDFQSRTLDQGAIGKYYRHDCPACGAQRADTPMGLEKIPDCLAWARDEPPCGECYTCNIVEVIAECARVLADDGVMFWNFGDSYCSGKSRHAAVAHTMSGKERGEPTEPGRKPDTRGHPVFRDTQLALIPHRVALAAQHRIGLLVRNDIIWWKPNGMPETLPYPLHYRTRTHMAFRQEREIQIQLSELLAALRGGHTGAAAAGSQRRGQIRRRRTRPIRQATPSFPPPPEYHRRTRPQATNARREQGRRWRDRDSGREGARGARRETQPQRCAAAGCLANGDGERQSPPSFQMPRLWETRANPIRARRKGSHMHTLQSALPRPHRPFCRFPPRTTPPCAAAFYRPGRPRA